MQIIALAYCYFVTSWLRLMLCIVTNIIAIIIVVVVVDIFEKKNKLLCKDNKTVSTVLKQFPVKI